MQNKENDFTLYLVIAIIYAVVLGIILFIFNLFTEEKETTASIVIQSFFFGIFMSLFEYWQNKRKKKKQ